MVTGAYYPETSGGGLQARAVARALRGEADFAVLTTSADPSLPARSEEDGIPVRRIHVDVQRAASTLTASARFAAAFASLAPRVDIVNLHGFSRKAIALVALSKAFRKRFVLTLQTSVHDEPPAVRAAGAAASWAYRSADLYLSVSPALSRGFLAAGLPESRLRQVANAVDTERFRPSTTDERDALRQELGLPRGLTLILFVGFFSRDKRPDAAWRAWSALAARDRSIALLMIGATQPVHGEVDATLGPAIRAAAEAAGLSDRLFFVEATPTIDRYFRAADLFIFPSIREGLPLALLEAMSSGLPSIASRLPGATDVLIDDDVSGLLVPSDDGPRLTDALRTLLTDRARAARLGAAARRTIVERFAIERVAKQWLAAYCELVAP